MTHSFFKKSVASALLLIFVSELWFITPASAATIWDTPSDEPYSFETLISEGAHIVCDELDYDIQVPVNTLVSFVTEQNLTSKSAKENMEFPLRVANDVIIDGQVVINAGSLATGRVIKAEKAKIFGKPGYLSIAVERIDIPGKTINVSGQEFSDEGESRSAIAWVCFGISLIILWPLIFVPFCIKGTEAEIPAGTRLSAYTANGYSPDTLSNPNVNEQ